jgi:flagellar basal-body rod modification protein FlgD
MAASALNLTSMLSPSNLLNKTSAAAQAKAQTTSTGTASSSTANDGLTGTTTGTTFLNLLVKELQNQDPTAPMDSTAMVGQMISLNQLDQLISINQVLSTATGATSSASSTGAVGSPAASSSAQMAQRAELLNSLQNTSASQLATNPNQTLDLSNLNIPNGGK